MPVKKWLVELSKLVFTHVVLIGVPTLVYYCLRLGGWDLFPIRLVIATFFLVSSGMIILETTCALFRRRAQTPPQPEHGIAVQLKRRLGIRDCALPWPSAPVPRSSFLIAAYLPNEQEIILETLLHILEKVQRPPGGLEVILAYNTPHDLPIEEELKLLTYTYPELRLLRVEGSHSKAENLNAGMDLVTGEIVGILDADHQPAPDCFARAWRWLGSGYDVVQGRNVIRNHYLNFLTQNIAIEFEALYGISHPAKSFLTDSCIFGGSNGYWRTGVLQRIRFDPRRMTEDIDATLRTLLNGYRILHDRSIITTELAPVDLGSFWFQRKRWSHGWIEVSFKYQRRVWRSRHLTPWQKLYWTYLLYYSDLYSLVALQILPVFLSLCLYQGFSSEANNAYLWISTLVTIFSGIYQTLATIKIAYLRYPLHYFFSSALAIFGYTIFKNSIAIVGFYDYLHGHNTWVITSRSQPRPTRSQTALAAGYRTN